MRRGEGRCEMEMVERRCWGKINTNCEWTNMRKGLGLDIIVVLFTEVNREGQIVFAARSVNGSSGTKCLRSSKLVLMLHEIRRD